MEEGVEVAMVEGWNVSLERGLGGNVAYLQPKAQKLKSSSSMNALLNTRPAMPRPSRTSSHFGSLFLVSHW
jgi:hypothetical protein